MKPSTDESPSSPSPTAAPGRAESPGAAAVRLCRWWPLLPLLVVSFYYLAQAAWVFPARLTSPYSVSVIEAQPVAGALRVVRGKTLYQDFRTGRPVLPLTYMELTYDLPGWAARLIGSTGGLAVARLGRAVSLLSFAGIVILLTSLGAERGVPARWAWLAALPLLWFPYPGEWFAKFAPDAPALFFSLLGWRLAGRPPGEQAAGRSTKGNRSEEEQVPTVSTSPAASTGDGWPLPPLSRHDAFRMLAALVAWLIGFNFKPTLLAGPIAFGVEHLHAALRPPATDRADRAFLRRRIFVRLFVLGGGFVLSALATLAIVQLATGGAWFDSFVRSSAVLSYSPAFVVDDLRTLRPEGLALFGLLSIWCLAGFRQTPLSLAFLFALLLDLLLMLKQGSNVNYLLDPIALAGLATTVAVARAARKRFAEFSASSPAAPRFLATPLLWFALPAAALLLVHPGKARVVYWEMFPPSAEELRVVDAAVKEVPRDRILCLDAFYGLSRNLPIPFADPYHAALLERRRLISFRPEVEGLRARRYRLVIWNLLEKNRVRYHGAPTYPESISDALRKDYRIVYQGNWLVLWAPKEKRE